MSAEIRERMLKLTQSDNSSGPKPNKTNTIFFQVLFVFSLCVLAYVIIEKNMTPTNDNPELAEELEGKIREAISKL